MATGYFDGWLDRLASRTVERGTLKKVDEVDGAGVWVRTFWDHPSGEDPLLTIKRIPARTILSNGLRRGLIDEYTKYLVTASSGNFLYELGIAANEISKETGLDLGVVGFVPRRIPETKLEIIRALGVDVVRVETEQDLCPREATVMAERRFASARRDTYNADQYISHENSLAHQLVTARTIDQEMESAGIKADKIVVPTGTGGTMSGLSTYFHLRYGERGNGPKIVGVQPPLNHHVLGVHHITIGEGCQWNPETYTALFDNSILTVDDADAYAATLKLREKGVPAGPSTGMVYHQALKEAAEGSNVILTSADNDLKYYGWTGEILSGEIGKEICSRYPDMRESLARYLDDLPGKPGSEEILKMVKRAYPSDSYGRVTTYEEFLKNNYSFD
jgi:cysteine synthase